MSTKSEPRCGHIALIGAPNAGKSTLMNRMVGAKVSIVTPKAQTTRTRVTGVVMEGQAQLVFLDVPGVFEATQGFEQSMVQAAWNAAKAADVVLFVQDARRKPDEETERVLACIRRMSGVELDTKRDAGSVSFPHRGKGWKGADVGSDHDRGHGVHQPPSHPSPDGGRSTEHVSRSKPCLLVLNKVDAVADKKTLLARTAWFTEQMAWQQIFMISAKKGDGVAELRDALAVLMPEGVHLYEKDAMTDMPMRLLASELTREQCFLKLQQELPYTLTVESEKYETLKDGSVKIDQNIIVQNERQKTILIGAKGAMLKTIGENARREISKLAGVKCHLYLFVKVRADWKEKPEAYRYLGLEFKQ